MVIERYPVHHGSDSLVMGAEFPALQACQLEPRPEAFRWGIVPTVAFSAHGGTYLPPTQGLLEFMAAILGVFNRSSQHL
jgi:hypothetical protein|tara:strand:- start:7 stop:243 length:237 start_codon:yes stop_codon:yes gene_type:complete